MKKLTIGLVTVLLATLAIVAAHGDNNRLQKDGKGESLENGNNQNSLDHRENTDFNIMPFIDGEEEFEHMQGMHEQRENNNIPCHGMMWR